MIFEEDVDGNWFNMGNVKSIQVNQCVDGTFEIDAIDEHNVYIVRYFATETEAKEFLSNWLPLHNVNMLSTLRKK